MNYKIKNCNNITLAYNHMQSMESVVIGIWVKTGSRYEDNSISGISHFLEHLVFRGTKNFTDTQIKQSIEGIGGSLNAFTSEEYTCYLVKVRKKYIDLAFKILSDMVLYPNLASKDIKSEKKIIIEEIKMYMDMPNRHVHNILDSLLWKGHPLGRMISGTTESVNSINESDLFKYKEKYYTARNLAVVVCGAFDVDSVGDLVNKYFLNINLGKNFDFIPCDIKQVEPYIKLIDHSTQQTHLALGSRALNRDHPKHGVLSLLNVIMGGNMSSRLFEHIREKENLAYDIGSRLDKYIDTGSFVVYGGIESQNLNKVIDIILSEFNILKKEVPSEDEMLRAKEYYKGQLLLMLEKTTENMIWFGDHVVTDSSLVKPEYFIEAIDKVTAEEVSQLAREILTYENISLAVIGNKISKKEKEIKKLLTKIK